MLVDAFLTAAGSVNSDDRVRIRNAAQEVRVWPRRFTPIVLLVGATSNDVELSIQCGCPEASIIRTDLGEVGQPNPKAHIVVFDERFNGVASPVQQERIQSACASRSIYMRITPTSDGLPFVDIIENNVTNEDTPLVTFITRSYRRPRQLSYNIASIKAQSSQRYQHIIITDDVGKGLHAANGSFNQVLSDIQGEYVMLLDDDDALCCLDLVSEVAHIRTFKGSPQVIVVQVSRITELVPDGPWWENETYNPSSHRVCNCYLLRRDFFLETIHAFNAPRAGDQHWQKEFYSKRPSFYWWKRLVSVNTRIGNCKAEENTEICQLH